MITTYVLAVLVGQYLTMPPSDHWDVRGTYESADACRMAWDGLLPIYKSAAKCMTPEQLAEARKPMRLPAATPFVNGDAP